MATAQGTLEPAIREIGGELYRLSVRARPALFDRGGLRGRVLHQALRDDALRTALFQFVDVLPQLDRPDSIAAHFRSYLSGRQLAGAWGRLLALGGHPFAAWAVRSSVARLARLFLVEENAAALQRALTRLRRLPAEATVDAVGEAVLTDAEAERYVARNLDLLRWLVQAGVTPNLSIKLSALTPRFEPLDPEGTRVRVFARLAPLMHQVVAGGAALTLDMENYELKPLILRLFRDLVAAHPEPGWLPGIALQTYLPETRKDLAQLADWARAAKRRICVRLVKGAYWDAEVAVAAARRWPMPVYLDKTDTDVQYERLTEFLFDHADVIYPAIAGHNLRSLANAIAQARSRGLAADRWEIQMLYGMAEPLRDALPSFGVRLRVYLPTGEMISGIAYLIRRLLENTASSSVLRHTYAEGASLDALLAPPAAGARTPPPAEAPDFANIPLTDFSRGETREAFAAALCRVRAQFGRRYPLIMRGAAGGVRDWHVSRNPAAPGEQLGAVELAGSDEAERAVRNGVSAFPKWRDTPAERRIELCLRAAGLMLAQRHELAAWQVFEVGKNWREADADVAEAIDMLRYYAAEMARLAGWRRTICFPGERNETRYEARGVALVVAPWNFPLAILTGMSAAALVTGNCVIMKPALPALLVARRLHDILLEAGFPEDVCQLLAGRGEQIGDLLVGHPDVSLIAFTGSREVGLSILEKAHARSPRQTQVKQVVCEMGGKNAIIVDDDADLDEAVSHTLYSAFGYQGQKCSAASRLIAVGSIHDRLVARLAAAADSFPLGPPEDPQYLYGPMINAAARQKALEYVDIGRREGTPYYQGKVPDADGYYVAPAIFTRIRPQHRLAREEIFGPVLCVLRAENFQHALELALDSDYALTGGVFSRRPEHLALAKARFRIGNLYLNRRITGAMVAAQPFGGAKLSGTGVQAGGADYLRQFLWSRMVSENILRHGFVPPDSTARR